MYTVNRHHLGVKVHFWPFDGWRFSSGKSVIAEVYSSIFRRRYEEAPDDLHQRDAYSTVCWLRDMNHHRRLRRYLHPALTTEQKEIAQKEGWILGVA